MKTALKLTLLQCELQHNLKRECSLFQIAKNRTVQVNQLVQLYI